MSCDHAVGAAPNNHAAVAAAQRTEVDGAACLVGLEHTVLIGHGAVRATGIMTACRMSETRVRGGVTQEVSRRLADRADPR